MWLMHSDYHRRALELAGARAKYGQDSPQAAEIVAEIRASMKWNLNFATDNQRYWQQRVSRRVLHGNHYDSWPMRERYVTCRPYVFALRNTKAEAYATAVADAAGLRSCWHRDQH